MRAVMPSSAIAAAMPRRRAGSAFPRGGRGAAAAGGLGFLGGDREDRGAGGARGGAGGEDERPLPARLRPGGDGAVGHQGGGVGGERGAEGGGEDLGGAASAVLVEQVEAGGES